MDAPKKLARTDDKVHLHFVAKTPRGVLELALECNLDAEPPPELVALVRAVLHLIDATPNAAIARWLRRVAERAIESGRPAHPDGPAAHGFQRAA